MDTLSLPTRYEVLERTAKEVQADITRIVECVPTANEHIQKLFLRMQQTHVSRFEVLYGVSGTGKTTFLETLPQFFDNLTVRVVPPTCLVRESVVKIQELVTSAKQDRIIIYFGGTGRDNPIESDEDFLVFFEHLRGYFRETSKLVIVIWPVSRPETALRLHNLAIEVGGDSLIGDSRTYYAFPGPDKAKYFSIADNTCRLMNKERSLAEYGIDEELGTGLLSQADTIAKYFHRMIEHSDQLNGTLANLLREKPRPRIWILLPGDETTQIMATVSQLTSGSKRRLDIAALTTDLSAEQASAQYMKDWERLRHYMQYLLRNLDVRVVEVPPSLALAIVRAFGTDDIRNKLIQKSCTSAQAISALRESMLGELLLNLEPRTRRAPRKTEKNTADEYIRIQSGAKGNDSLLNAPFAIAIEQLLGSQGRQIQVGRKQEIYNGLRPDVHVPVALGEPICLEFTWRTTGRQIDGVSAGKQNTLTPGHIRQYLLAKVFEYVKALGLDLLAANGPQP